MNPNGEKKCDYKYNYVFFSVSEDYHEPMFYGLNDLENVELRKSALPNKKRFAKKLLKLHYSNKLNKIIKLPFKKAWLPKMCKTNFKNGKPTCYVFYGSKFIEPDSGIVKYIRKHYPDSKIVVMFCDLIRNNVSKRIDIIRDQIDLFSSYDIQDAKKNGIEYLEETMYGRQLEVTKPVEFDSDLFFLGYSKGRLELLLKLCQYLQERGVKCDFRIVAVPKEQQVQMDGVTYLDKPMKYLDYIRDAQKTRCLLEMPQVNSVDITMRTVEAIAYKRKLLTNATHIVNSEYYVPAQMKTFEALEDIDVEFLKTPNDYTAFENDFDFSPEKRLEFIEKHIS